MPPRVEGDTSQVFSAASTNLLVPTYADGSGPKAGDLLATFLTLTVVRPAPSGWAELHYASLNPSAGASIATWIGSRECTGAEGATLPFALPSTSLTAMCTLLISGVLSPAIEDAASVGFTSGSDSGTLSIGGITPVTSNALICSAFGFVNGNLTNASVASLDAGQVRRATVNTGALSTGKRLLGVGTKMLLVPATVTVSATTNTADTRAGASVILRPKPPPAFVGAVGQ